MQGERTRSPLPSGERLKGVQGACSLLGAAGQTAPQTLLMLLRKKSPADGEGFVF